MIDFYLFQVSIPLLWLSAGILIGSTEFIFPTNVSIWPGIAALLVSLLTALGLIYEYNFPWQFFWFAVFTIALTLLWFMVIKRYTHFGSSTVDEHRDMSMVSLRGTVEEIIRPGRPGSVELFSSYHGIRKWKAESSQTIEPGSEVTIEDADGIKLIVKKVSE
ncbi:MAG: NfeD family protein [Spirochaetes bacterium]|jgi:membrane protein implicated in regulation of membrane protease activity|nr:NfeD family protein [Spirochaetota bacterium]